MKISSTKVGLALSSVVLIITPSLARAHVKWFCAYDVAGNPLGLENVLCSDFEELVALSAVLLLFGCIIERTGLGRAMLRSLDATTGVLQRYSEIMLRVVAGGFFLCLWASMHVILTPELTTDIWIVPWLQLIIALMMVFRRTLPFASAGIVTLFAIGIVQYGVFHLMDYPVFLGLAAYLACVGLGRAPFGMRPLDILRWSAAITLMWASIEKWAYPQWTIPMFVSHPEVSFGLDLAFYMRAAGVVEFACAFALIWTPLVRRISAVMLAATFVAAIGEFGMIDAIGHSCIIAVLLAILSDNKRDTVPRRTVAWMPLTYSAALAAFLVSYYGLHRVMFDGVIG